MKAISDGKDRLAFPVEDNHCPLHLPARHRLIFTLAEMPHQGGEPNGRIRLFLYLSEYRASRVRI